jgi:hypothetical protein
MARTLMMDKQGSRKEPLRVAEKAKPKQGEGARALRWSSHPKTGPEV